MGRERIAIVGMGLRYPDAQSPTDLWDNVLAGRRAFRTLPSERMNLADYWDPDPDAPDKFYSRKAAVLRDYHFDRVSRLIPARTMESTDMTHWLALEVAGTALAAAGFPEGEGLPLARTGVVLGNTLTGEFSRANVMRLRWPYVRRTVSAQLAQAGWDSPQIDAFVHDLENTYKAPFPEITEDTLAGGLANTIAGRICNYYDLGGGGFTVDGACSSSLLSVISGAQNLTNHDLDVAVVGGVDLSIDPFEVIGFAKTGALARREMRVYDRDSNGFWPGEGCGMVVLMRESDARDQGKEIYSLISGWGMSSDGKGGLTRPEADGHRRALAQAYERAGYGADAVGYFEGHGTGTAVGDATEIAVFASTRDGVEHPVPAALSSIKANIGHTKAASGVAGLIKATMAVYHQVIPPATGQVDPHPALLEHADTLTVPHRAALWPAELKVRAGVSAMGFGGINTHIALESASPDRAQVVPTTMTRQVSGRQDVELLLLAGESAEDLLAAIAGVRETLERSATCELTDMAVSLQKNQARGPLRLGLVAKDPEEAVRRLDLAAGAITTGAAESDRLHRVDEGCWFMNGSRPAVIAFAFPGQGAGTGRIGAVTRRFGGPAETAGSETTTATDVLQPRIMARTLEALNALQHLGIRADAAIGHSLGEIAALTWAGALSDQQAREISEVRGASMAEHVPSNGAMAALGVTPEQAARYLTGTEAVVSGHNAPTLTVVSGSRSSIDAVCAAAGNDGAPTTRLNVKHAFHSPHCAPAANVFGAKIIGTAFALPHATVTSPSLGGLLPADTDLHTFLVDQVTRPVLFTEAAQELRDYDAIIEVGPGHTLTSLLHETLPDVTSIATDTDSRSLAPFLEAVALAFVGGQEIDTQRLAGDRVYRNLEPHQQMTFLANPCETAPQLGFVPSEPAATSQEPDNDRPNEGVDGGESTLDVLRAILAEKVDLPLEVMTAETNPLDDLHLSSITVGQIVNEVVRSLGRGPLTGVPAFATSNLQAIATMIDDMAQTADTDASTTVTGAGPWIRAFEEVLEDGPLQPAPTYTQQSRRWHVVGPEDEFVTTIRERVGRLPNHARGVLVVTMGKGPEEGADAIDKALGFIRSCTSDCSLVVVQRGPFGAAAMAKTVFLEGLSSRVTVISIPHDVNLEDSLADSIATDINRNGGFAEVTYAVTGKRRTTSWQALTPAATADTGHHLGPDDVLLATGGSKGITAACALRLAQDAGASVAFMARADITHDDVAATLEEARRAGVRHVYVQGDVTDPDSVREAVARVRATLGEITAVLHGAGRNTPQATNEVTREDLDATIAPKVQGLRNVLAALHPQRLRLLLAFGSIIGRAGLQGEVHYATANSWLTDEVTAYGQEHPHVRVRSLEWSVWSGVGMGERLGVVESLRRRGIEPIPAQWGIDLVGPLVDDPALPAVMVVAGRTGSMPTMRLTQQEVPLLRFLERPQVHYAGVELVADADLSVGKDLYLLDHTLDGEFVFPAVMGMEAMAQAAAALRPELRSGLAFTNLKFERPIIVPHDGEEKIRIVALVEQDQIRVGIRSSTTGFAIDHFSGVVNARRGAPPPAPTASLGLDPIEMDPRAELYGSVMFQGKRFQKIRNYRVAAARAAVLELDTTQTHAWFSSFLPQDLVLSDPGARDAMMHGLQCCVPDAVLLPSAVASIAPAPSSISGTSLVMEAHEVAHDGDVYTYDVTAYDRDGTAVEWWTGLRLHAVRRNTASSMRWAPAMVSAYLQRQTEDLIGSFEVVVEPHRDRAGGNRRAFQEATDRAVTRLRPGVAIKRRGDGRLLLTNGSDACSAHHSRFTMAVLGKSPVACDTEAVTTRGDIAWQDLLGTEWPLAREVATTTGCSFDEAATRVWGAMECIRKVGHSSIGLTLGAAANGSVLLSAGPYRVATWCLDIDDNDSDTMFAVLGGQ